jgi:AraC-like DNA-binding protein
MDVATWLAGAGAVGDGGMARRRFTAGPAWDTGERQLPEHLVYAIHGGLARLESDGSGWLLGPGRACLVPPGVRFRVRAGTPPPRLTRLRLAMAEPWGSETVVFDVTAELRRVLDLLADRPDPGLVEAAAWDRAGGLLLATALARAIAGRGAVGLLARCTALVEREPHLDPRALAAACGLSHDWFTRAFRAAAGRPPRRWLVEARVRLAADRLAEGREPAWVVAQRLGWRDAKLFGRQFRSVMGEAPGRWRRTEGPAG